MLKLPFNRHLIFHVNDVAIFIGHLHCCQDISMKIFRRQAIEKDLPEFDRPCEMETVWN